MKPTLLAGLALAALAAATAASAQETTVIHHTRRVEAQTVVEPQEQTRTVVHRHVAKVYRGYHAASAHRLRRHVTRRATAVATGVDSRSETRETTEGAAVSERTGTIVDRKAVIHRDEDGNVSRRVRVTRTHPDGSTETVIKHSRDEATPPPPRDDPDPHR